jgi:hypothetical protein
MLYCIISPRFTKAQLTANTIFGLLNIISLAKDIVKEIMFNHSMLKVPYCHIFLLPILVQEIFNFHEFSFGKL